MPYTHRKRSHLKPPFQLCILKCFLATIMTIAHDFWGKGGWARELKVRNRARFK